MQESHLCAIRWPGNETKLPKSYPNSLYTIGINYIIPIHMNSIKQMQTMTKNVVQATDMQARTCVQFTRKWSQN